jgi:CheY-like chemotaxis protein
MCNILVVEDHEDWQDILPEKIQQAFKELGYPSPSITVETTFKEANRLLKEKQWDLLVTDLGLGPRSRELLGRMLIETAQAQNIPSIAVSGSEQAYTQRDLNELRSLYGSADFFTKLPFDTKGFIKKVQELVAQTSSPNIDIKKPEKNLLSNNLPGKCFALLIGISEYKNINRLSKTTVDAEDLYTTLLQQGYSKENVFLLCNYEATKNQIGDRLDWLARRVKHEDTVLFFFSGHGLQFKGGFHPGEYLCSVQADLSNLQDTCISHEEFTRALNSIHAGRLVVFLDACHSGGVGTPRDINPSVVEGLSESFYKSLAQGKGRAIIAACMPNEVAWELGEMRNGLFTHYLLEGIKGGAAQNEVVTVSRLFAYIYEHVVSHGNHQPPYQHPYQKSEGEDFIITPKLFEHALN